MNKPSRRKILIVSATLVLGAWATGIVMANTNLNGVPCGRTGFAAAMNKVFFGPSGGCALLTTDTTKCAHAGYNCTISGTTTTGKCTQQALACACVVTPH